MQITQYLKWPWLVSVPLLLAGYVCSVFFIGTDSLLFAPSILCLLANDQSYMVKCPLYQHAVYDYR